MSTALGSAISTGTYRPGDERIVRVAKSSGVGTRPIVVSEVQDRVVAKAIAVVIRPMIDPLLDPLSFGFRPRRRREQALAVAEQLAENGYTHWVAHDFVDAFGRVPVKRLGDVLFRHLPCARLRDLAVMILPPKSPSLGGIKQGNPLSALALELYLNHFVDRPWRADKSDTRLIRYADDLLLMSRSREDAVLADSRLRQLSTPAGMLVKQPLESALTDIRTADAEWLGYRVRSSAGEFQVRLGTRAYDKLVMRLMLAHTKSQPARRAVQVLRNWSAQLGPMYGTEDTDVICERAVNSARKMSFVENISADELTRIWSAAAKRWRRTRREVRANPAYLATGVVTPPCPTSVVY